MGVKISNFTYSDLTGSDKIPFVKDGDLVNNYIGTVSSLSASLIPVNSLTASYVTASNVFGTVTSSSYALSGSYALSASYSLSSSYAISSSQALSSSYALTASYALSSSRALSSSYALSGSYALTASYSMNGGGGSGITINNDLDNRILTATGNSSTLNAESNLVFDGAQLLNNNSSGTAKFAYYSASNGAGTVTTGVGFYGTSSYAISSSQTISSSYSLSSSYAISSSQALSSSYAISSSQALSSSYAISSSQALSSSFAESSSYSNYSSQSLRTTYIDSEYNNQAIMFSTYSNMGGGMYGDKGYTYFITRNKNIGFIGYPSATYPYHFLFKSFNGYSSYISMATGISVDTVGDYASSVKLDVSNRSIKKMINNFYSTYILFDDGTLLGRGINSHGELGQGHNTTSWAKTSNANTYGMVPWFQISGKGSLSGKTVIDIDICSAANDIQEENLFILTSTSSGNNIHACGYQASYGQFGIGNLNNYNVPTQILSNNLTASKIYNGGQTWYWISTTGDLYGAGLNHYGTLGVGDTSNRNTWARAKIGASNFLTNVRSVHGGHNAGNSYQTFVIKNDNTVWGSGVNSSGRLGLGDTVDRYYFTQLTGSDNNFSASNITTMTLYTQDYNTYIAVLTGSGQTGSIKSWGYNSHGIYGDNTNVDKYVPTSPSGGSASEIVGKVAKVIPRFWHSYDYVMDSVILTTDGKLYSTGEGYYTRGINKQTFTATEKYTYQKVDLSQLDEDDVIIDVTSGNQNVSYWAYYALTNKGNVLSWGLYYANGRQYLGDNLIPEYIYKDGKFVSMSM